MRKAIQAFVLVLAVATVAPLGAQAVSSRAGTSAASPAVPARLVGKWTKTVTAATWHRNQVYGEIAGRWTMVIAPSGKASLYVPLAGKPFLLTSMHTETTGSSIVFGPTSDAVCPRKASFSWSLSGGALALAAAKDDCIARRVLMTAGSWTRA